MAARAFRASGWDVQVAARGPRGGEIHIDLDRPATIAAALRGHELVVNAVPHHGLLAERAVLAHGGVLINISALPAACVRSLRAEAGGANGTVLMNAGLAPGVTNLVAAELLRAHPEATELEIVLTLSSVAPRGPAGVDFIHHGLLGVSCHRTVSVPLPEPFGRTRCVGFREYDAGWLGGVAEGQVVRLYVCIAQAATHERLLKLNAAGTIHDLPRSLFRARPSPNTDALAQDPVAHWIAARRGERRLAARTVECRGALVHAAKAATLFAELLLTRQPPRGCFGPEEVCTLSGLESRLRAAGIRIVDRG